MTFHVVHAYERGTGAMGQRLPERHPDEQGANETGTGRDGDGVEVA